MAKAFTTTDKFWIYKSETNSQWTVILPVEMRDPGLPVDGVRRFGRYQQALDFVVFMLWAHPDLGGGIQLPWSRGLSYR